MSAQSTFAYRARDASGAVVDGSMVASSADEVGARLRADGKFVVNVQDHAFRADVQTEEVRWRRIEAARRVRREEVIAFCQQMAVMLETGVPLSEALDALCVQAPEGHFRTILETVRETIYNGEKFSTALKRWPRVFPVIMISLMKASEASGTMAEMLGRVGDYLASERRTARQVKGALAYPLFMMATAVVLTLFLTAFVLPRFAQIYEARSASLPAPTQVLLATSDFLSTGYLWYGPVLAGLVIGFLVVKQTAAAKRGRDWLRLNLPVISSVYRKLYLMRSARTMATLLASGVNLLDIIDICRSVTNNSYYDELWDDMANGVRGGKQISHTTFNHSLVPMQIASMIAAGERSGKLPEVMDRIAVFTQEELDNSVKQATALIEPIMIIFMGLIVGGVAVALLLPVFTMGRIVTGG